MHTNKILCAAARGMSENAGFGQEIEQNMNYSFYLNSCKIGVMETKETKEE